MSDGSVPEPVRVEFTPTFDEYAELMYWVRTRPPMAIGMTVMMVLVSLAFAALYSQSSRSTWQLFIPVVVLPAVYFLGLRRFARPVDQKRWDAAVELRSPRTFAFSPDRIEITTSEGRSEFSWSLITRAYRT